MGLDMYFFASREVPADINEQDINDENIAGTDVHEKYNMQEIQYFRKHSDLHGLLEQCWCNYTNDKDCNCKYMEITPQLIDLIRRMANNPPTEHSQGFYWGQSNANDWLDTFTLCDTVDELLTNHERVFYYAWY